MQQSHGFSVPFKFPVHFTQDAWNTANTVFFDVIRREEAHRRHRVLAVVDSEVASAHPSLLPDIRKYFAAFPDALELVGPPVIVPGGEVVKNDFSYSLEILARINDVGLDRQSFVVVIGGGAVLDMASFAAAIAHRGIRVIRFPTTVLSQADSGIAVKNGINLFGKKNFVGTFVPPFAVINDSCFLESLSQRDRISGVVEAIKVALLRDPGVLSLSGNERRQHRQRRTFVLPSLIRRSAELHLAHICGNGDPFELGSARPLDFGHWAAHKLESMTHHRLRHGEAVAIGIALDVIYSVRKGHSRPSWPIASCRLLEGIGFRALGRRARAGARRRASLNHPGAAGIPRAPWRRTAHHAAARHRSELRSDGDGRRGRGRRHRRARGARRGRSSERIIRASSRRLRSAVDDGRRTVPPHLLLEHSSRRNMGRGQRGAGGIAAASPGAARASRARFAVGLRLSAEAAKTLEQPTELAAVSRVPARRRLLRSHDQRLSRTAPFTVSGSRSRCTCPTGATRRARLHQQAGAAAVGAAGRAA